MPKYFPPIFFNLLGKEIRYIRTCFSLLTPVKILWYRKSQSGEIIHILLLDWILNEKLQKFGLLNAFYRCLSGFILSPSILYERTSQRKTTIQLIHAYPCIFKDELKQNFKLDDKESFLSAFKAVHSYSCLNLNI